MWPDPNSGPGTEKETAQGHSWHMQACGAIPQHAGKVVHDSWGNPVASAGVIE